jgi:hypothetical protein
MDMDTPEKVIKAIFYATTTGNEPVRNWLMSLSIDE